MTRHSADMGQKRVEETVRSQGTINFPPIKRLKLESFTCLVQFPPKKTPRARSMLVRLAEDAQQQLLKTLT